MNKSISTGGSTPEALVKAALELFAQQGYDGTSVRAITRRAGANLGAITYHFGSKEALYHAVLVAANAAIDERIMAVVNDEGAPLDRIVGFVKALFDVFAEQPLYTPLVMHELTRLRAFPDELQAALQRRIAALVQLIQEGQKDGSIRPGDPTLMALSVASQPIWITIAARPLSQAARIDQTDPGKRKQIVASVVEFVREGLAAHPEK